MLKEGGNVFGGRLFVLFGNGILVQDCCSGDGENLSKVLEMGLEFISMGLFQNVGKSKVPLLIQLFSKK